MSDPGLWRLIGRLVQRFISFETIVENDESARLARLRGPTFGARCVGVDYGGPARPWALKPLGRRVLIAAVVTIFILIDLCLVAPALGGTPSQESAGRPTAAPSHEQPVGRDVVYLVDVSGSVVDRLPDAIEWLKRHMATLSPADRFTILFSRENEIFEAGPPGFKSADAVTRRRVADWVDPDAGNVAARGRSDLLTGLFVALGVDADVIYVLTDDLPRAASAEAPAARRRPPADAPGGAGDPVPGDAAEVDDRDYRLIREVKLTVSARRGLRIHTVQFFARDSSGILAALAECTGGTYTLVPPPDPDAEQNGESAVRRPVASVSSAR